MPIDPSLWLALSEPGTFKGVVVISDSKKYKNKNDFAHFPVLV